MTTTLSRRARRTSELGLGAIGVGIIAIGTRFLVRPEAAAAGYGVRTAPQDPYLAVKGTVPFDVNTASSPGAALSGTLDFSTYDRVDEQLLNAILYADARHSPLVLPGP